MPPPFIPLFIDGQQVPSSDGGTFPVHNPFSNQLVGISSSASSVDCTNAILSASKAFKSWQHSTWNERYDVFLKATDLLKSDKYEEMVMNAVVEETAATPGVAMLNWAASVDTLRDTTTLINHLELGGRTFPSRQIKGATVTVERRAMGVIFCLSPWNLPVPLALRAILFPILCGNTVVFRSSEVSPRSHAIVFELFQEAGLPAGVFNFISTSRETAPRLTAEIIAHPLVRKINFTGSDRVGRLIAIEAAKYLKPCVLELGGKAPVIILEDADITEAAKTIVQGALVHSGQFCISTERVIVQRGVYDNLRDQICDIARSITARNPCPHQPETDSDITAAMDLGPVISESSAENIIAMIREAKEAGASVLVGEGIRDGSIVQPHVVTDVKPGMRLWDKESFGPVIVIVAADSIEEAIELANASDYSLSAALWTSNLYLAKEVSSRIRSGYVNINGGTVFNEFTFGIAGLGGSSGYGRFSVDDFTDQRVVVTHPLGAPSYGNYLTSA